MKKEMKKGFMFRSNDFGTVTSVNTSDSQQEAKTPGISNDVVKPTKTDEMTGNHKGRYFSK